MDKIFYVQLKNSVKDKQEVKFGSFYAISPKVNIVIKKMKIGTRNITTFFSQCILKNNPFPPPQKKKKVTDVILTKKYYEIQ